MIGIDDTGLGKWAKESETGAVQGHAGMAYDYREGIEAEDNQGGAQAKDKE